jgi:hypothetical protein
VATGRGASWGSGLTTDFGFGFGFLVRGAGRLRGTLAGFEETGGATGAGGGDDLSSDGGTRLSSSTVPSSILVEDAGVKTLVAPLVEADELVVRSMISPFFRALVRCLPNQLLIHFAGLNPKS